MVQQEIFRRSPVFVFIMSAIMSSGFSFSASAQGKASKAASAKSNSPQPAATLSRATPSTSLENLFEGYYKITLAGKHIGFLIARYDYDTKQKQFFAKTFQKIKTSSEEEMQSLVAVSDDGFNPVKYEFTSTLKQGETTKIRTIDAQFKANKMTALFQEDGVKKTIKKDIPKGVFLSTFLTYLILKQPKGLTANLNINYSAIAEEDADIYSGKVSTGTMQKMKNLSVYEAKTEYKQNQFVAYISDRGEVLATASPLSNVSSELVAQPSEATQGFEMNSKTLQTLFGEIPFGINNMIAKAARSNSILPAQQEGGKTSGVLPGQGIQIKNSAPAVPADQKGN